MQLSINVLFIFSIFFIINSCSAPDEVEDKIVLIKITCSNKTESGGMVNGLIGDVAIFQAEGVNDRGTSFDPDVTWSSSNKTVATVDNSGTAQLLAAGNTTITASGYGLTSNALVLSVVETEEEVAKIEITGNKTTIAIEETSQLTAKALDINNNEVPGISVTWSSENTEVATVSSSGLITGIGNGQAKIRAKYENITGSYTIMVGENTNDFRTGNFSGLGGHDVSGSVTLTASGESSLSLMLGSDFSTINGPSLFIYLSEHEDNVEGGFEVAALRSNSGADTYAIEGIAIDKYDYVIIYCKPVGIPFGTAKLD